MAHMELTVYQHLGWKKKKAGLMPCRMWYLKGSEGSHREQLNVLSKREAQVNINDVS